MHLSPKVKTNVLSSTETKVCPSGTILLVQNAYGTTCLGVELSKLSKIQLLRCEGRYAKGWNPNIIITDSLRKTLGVLVNLRDKRRSSVKQSDIN